MTVMDLEEDRLRLELFELDQSELVRINKVPETQVRAE